MTRWSLTPFFLGTSLLRKDVHEMEVNKVGRTSMNKIKPKQDTSLEKTSFAEVMNQKKDQLNQEKFNQLVLDIEEQGKVLAQSQTVEDLREYKKLIKEFMDEAVKYGLSLEERRGFNRRGRTKVYKIVEEVDKKLLELTNTVLKQEEKGLKILDLVGEIKGLLINVYT